MPLLRDPPLVIVDPAGTLFGAQALSIGVSFAPAFHLLTSFHWTLLPFWACSTDGYRPVLRTTSLVSRPTRYYTDPLSTPDTTRLHPAKKSRCRTGYTGHCGRGHLTPVVCYLTW